jgi:hypothetical protein
VRARSISSLRTQAGSGLIDDVLDVPKIAQMIRDGELNFTGIKVKVDLNKGKRSGMMVVFLITGAIAGAMLRIVAL